MLNFTFVVARHLLTYSGNVFDQTDNSGPPVSQLVAECSPTAINGSLPGWVWSSLNLETGEKEFDYRDYGALVPECSKYYVVRGAYYILQLSAS